MYDRVIVASGDRDLRLSWKAIIEILCQTIMPACKIAACRDAEDARQTWEQNRQNRDLIIVDRLLPASDDPKAVSGVLGAGFDLVQAMQEGEPRPACILVGISDNRINLAALEWPLAGMLADDKPQLSDMAEDFRKMAEGLAERRDRSAQAAPAVAAPLQSADKPWGLLEINLDDARRSYFSLQTGAGKRSNDRMEYPFELDVIELQKVVAASRALRKKISDCLHDQQAWANYVSDWRRDYEKLGRSVYELINRDQFHRCLGALLTVPENARLRFVLDENSYDGLWESIFHPDDRWLMLKSTIARRARLTSPVDAHRLDGNDGTVHMLAIASNIPDKSVVAGPNDMGWKIFWNDYYGRLKENCYRKNGRLPRLNEVLLPLPEVDKEISHLKKLKEEINRRHEAGKIAVNLDVEEFRGEGPAAAMSLSKRVQQALTGRPPRPDGSPQFDVVHFSGHAIFNDGNRPHERGYLVFGDEPQTEMIPVAEFADWLRKAGVQMVYLSCCRSSAARAAFELADAGIPLAIGFTWDLDSALATEFSEAFYGELLLNDLKVCKAFQSARRSLPNKHGDSDPIWTSPVLVAQPTDWLSVESYLAERR